MELASTDDVVLTDREVKRLKRYDGYRYWLAVLLPLLPALVGIAYLLITTKIGSRLNLDLLDLVRAWQKKGLNHETTYPSTLIAAFDRLETAFIFLGMSLAVLPWSIEVRHERRLFAKLLLLYNRAKESRRS